MSNELKAPIITNEKEAGRRAFVEEISFTFSFFYSSAQAAHCKLYYATLSALVNTSVYFYLS